MLVDIIDIVDILILKWLSSIVYKLDWSTVNCNIKWLTHHSKKEIQAYFGISFHATYVELKKSQILKEKKELLCTN